MTYNALFTSTVRADPVFYPGQSVFINARTAHYNDNVSLHCRKAQISCFQFTLRVQAHLALTRVFLK